MSTTLKVLNLNVWDLPYSQDLPSRIAALCRVLESNDLGPNRGYDIIGMQEAFMEEDRQLMTAAARKGGLMYSHFYDAGVGFPAYPKPGHPSGLLILSRYPIIQVAYLRYSLNGKPHRLLHWDWQTGKGCGLARIATPFGLIDVFLSHFIASYTPSPEAEDEYLHDRVAQAYECAEFIQMSRRAPLAMLLCDLNSMPGSLPYQIISSLSGLNDAYEVAYPGTSAHPSAKTCNVNRYADGFPRRVDFVFYSTRPLPALPTNLDSAAVAMNHYLGDCYSADSAQHEHVCMTDPASTERKEVHSEHVGDSLSGPSAPAILLTNESATTTTVVEPTSATNLSPPSLASSTHSNTSSSASAVTSQGRARPRQAFRQSSLHCPNTLGLAWDISDHRFVMTRPLPRAFVTAPRGLMWVPTEELTTETPKGVIPAATDNKSAAPQYALFSSSVLTRITRFGATMLSAISMATYRRPSRRTKCRDRSPSQQQDAKGSSTPNQGPKATSADVEGTARELIGYGGYALARQLGYDMFGELNRGAYGTDILYLKDPDELDDTDPVPLPAPDLKDNIAATTKARAAPKPEVKLPTPSGITPLAVTESTKEATTKSFEQEMQLYNDYESKEVDWNRPLFLSDHVGIAVSFELRWDKPMSSRSPPPSPRQIVSQSSVLRPLDLGLDAEQEKVLREALHLMDQGLLDAKGRQRNHHRHLFYGAFAAVLACLAGFSGLLSPWSLAVLLPLCTLYVVYNFFIRTLFGNEEQSAMTAVRHAMALRLMVGSTRIAAGFLPTPSNATLPLNTSAPDTKSASGFISQLLPTIVSPHRLADSASTAPNDDADGHTIDLEPLSKKAGPPSLASTERLPARTILQRVRTGSSASAASSFSSSIPSNPLPEEDARVELTQRISGSRKTGASSDDEGGFTVETTVRSRRPTCPE